MRVYYFHLHVTYPYMELQSINNRDSPLVLYIITCDISDIMSINLSLIYKHNEFH